MELILASASPRRSSLLKDAGFACFRIVPANVKEFSPENCRDVHAIAENNAVLKAEFVSILEPNSLVIGADTVIEFGNEVIGKPSDLKDAFRILRRLSGRTHIVATGVCLCCQNPHIKKSFTVRTEVAFRELSDHDIEHYLACVPVLDKAGAYGIQEHGDWIIDHTNGSFTNIIGLPVEKVTEELAHLLPTPPSMAVSAE